MAIKDVVLVHGAWGDGSHWRKVIPLLHARGYRTTAVQNPLSSIDDDVRRTTAAIGTHENPVLLVGHSYGGVVISGAGRDSKVAGLVYVAAFAPEEGESAFDLVSRGGGAVPENLFLPDADEYLWLNREMFHDAFCADLDAEEALLMAATQKPIAPACLQTAFQGAPAWKTKPSWYQVSQEDRSIPPDNERYMAERIKPRKTIELAAAHASMASQPEEIAALIDEAAQAL